MRMHCIVACISKEASLGLWVGMLRIVLGGSFEFIHKGHEKLIERAFREAGNGEVLIGLMDDEFSEKKGCAKGFGERKRALSDYLEKNHKKKHWEILSLFNPYGITLEENSIDGIVASEETLGVAEKINLERRKRRMKELKILVERVVYAQDLKKISSHRIRNGIIDEEGKRKTPVKIAICSKNKAKVNGTRNALGKIFKNTEFKLIEKSVASKVSKQPFGIETIRGAEKRAKNGWEKGIDFSIGLESGIFEYEVSKGRKIALDSLWCAVYDGEEKEILYSHSLGFQIDDKTLEELKKGEELSDVFNLPKDEKGVLHLLSRGILKREQMAEEAVICAFLQRIWRRD